MDFCIPFTRDVRYKEMVDNAAELDIAFDDTRKNFDKLVAFCKAYPDKRVNIHCVNRAGVDTALAVRLQEQVSNVAWCLNIVDAIKTEALQECGAKFYFCDEVSANNFFRLRTLASLGVSDVYLNDDTCYNLDRVSEYCKAHGIRIRWVLNRVQNTFVNKVDYTVAFIRPDDMQEYSKYIDVGEFFCGSVERYDYKKAKVYYKYWYKKESWVGNLQEIIPSLSVPVFDKSLPKGAFRRKQNCRLKCVSEGASCMRCEEESKLCLALAEKGILYKKERKRHETRESGHPERGAEDAVPAVGDAE